MTTIEIEKLNGGYLMEINDERFVCSSDEEAAKVILAELAKPQIKIKTKKPKKVKPPNMQEDLKRMQEQSMQEQAHNSGIPVEFLPEAAK